MQYTVSNLFSLVITHKTTSTKIIMTMHNKTLNTNTLPQTHYLLQQRLPSVLHTQCYNDENLPFSTEVRSTEIGHLFEHILLEYLCQIKISRGYNSAVFSGRTRWNWVRDPRGMFHIYLSCGQKDAQLFPEALEKTIRLMKIILNDNQEPLFPFHRFFFSRNGLKNGKKIKKLFRKTLLPLKIKK
jgi:hypothetical protein